MYVLIMIVNYLHQYKQYKCNQTQLIILLYIAHCNYIIIVIHHYKYVNNNSFRAFTTVLSGIGEQFSPSRYPGITSGYINDVSCVSITILVYSN